MGEDTNEREGEMEKSSGSISRDFGRKSGMSEKKREFSPYDIQIVQFPYLKHHPNFRNLKDIQKVISNEEVQKKMEHLKKMVGQVQIPMSCNFVYPHFPNKLSNLVRENSMNL